MKTYADDKDGFRHDRGLGITDAIWKLTNDLDPVLQEVVKMKDETSG